MSDQLIGAAFLSVCLIVISWHWNPWVSALFAFCGVMSYVYAIDSIKKSAGGK